jgi:predicted anti-sigma-YlaC factor YlaD
MPMSTVEGPIGCQSARGWQSAYRDGETFNDARAADHIQACPGCTAWVEALDGLTGRLRVRSAASHDLVGPALAAWRSRAERGADQRARAGRAVLLSAGLAGLLLAVSRLVGFPPVSPRISAHAGRELAAFEAALAVGFILAAWRPRRHADGLLVVALTVTAFTVAGASADLLVGRHQLGSEVAHLPLLAGTLGLVLTQLWSGRGSPPATSAASEPPSAGAGPHPPPTPATE